MVQRSWGNFKEAVALARAVFKFRFECDTY
jgi:hypothetical protein